MTSLATPEEVSRSMATADSHIEATQFRLVLPVMEQYLFDTTLGREWYDSLLSDLRDVSAATRYSELVNYSIGDLVTYYESYYEAIAENRAKTPNLSAYWQRLTKFQTPANNIIFDGYLLPLIALAAASPTSAMTAIQNSNIGLVRRSSDNARPASMREIIAYRQDLEQLMRIALFNLHRYCKDNATLYPLYLGNSQPQRQVLPRRYHGFNFQE